MICIHVQQRRDCQYGFSSVIQISFKSILAKFLNFFRVKAFCKKACCEWDSIWGLLGGSPVSLPLYQHNVLENVDYNQSYKVSMGKVASMKIDYNQLLKHLNQQIFFSPKLSKITYWQSLLCLLERMKIKSY